MVVLTLGATGTHLGITGTTLCADEPVKITYDDHVKPILREHCTSCHNANDKKSGLALDTYQAVMTGGSGGEVVYEGDLDSSRLYALVAHQEQPYMPPNQDMIAQAKVDLIKTWIEQGMPENSGSEIKKSKANSMALTVTIGRPEGAPPMPESLLKQTPFATSRAATISALAASPWSPLVAVGGQRQVSLYHSETGELLGILPFPEGEPQSITFSRDGKLILIGGGRHSHSGYAALYEIATGKRIARVGDELDIVLSADINDNNQLIALAGPQKMVRVYETLTGELKYEQKKHTDWIYSVRFSPDGLLLASADRSAGLVVWEADSGRLYLDLQGHKGEIRGTAWRPDSAALISASMDGTLKLWEMNEGAVIKSWDAHPGGVLAVGVCNDGTMVSTGADNKVKVWDIGGNAAGEMPPLAEAGYAVAITVDGKQVAAGDWAGNVRLWQRANPQDEKSIPANPQPLEQLLAKAQADLQQATEKQKGLEADYLAKSSQQGALQKELEALRGELAATTAELTTSTNRRNEIKPDYESLTAEHTKQIAELQAARESVAPKKKLLGVAATNKETLEAELASLKQGRGTEGADIEGHDIKIAEIGDQIAIQIAAIAQIQGELSPLQSDLEKRELAYGELKPKVDEVSKEWSGLSAAIDTLTAKKNQIEPTVAPKESALQAATEGATQAKAALDESNGALSGAQALVAKLEGDLAAFRNRSVELVSKKTELEKAIAAAQEEVPQVETSIATTKDRSEAIAAEIAKLEAQLAELNKRKAEEGTKRESALAEMAAKEESLKSLQEKINQLESDAAESASQLELFEKAYSSK